VEHLMRLLLFVGLAGCAATLPDDTPYVTDARVLAVRLDPPEAEPATDVVLTALYADATGALASAPVDWSACLTPHPLAELGPVARSCLDEGSDDLEAIGTGIRVTARLPADGCSLFGPNPPPSEDGTTAGRPADPDVTGGFYQPIVGFIDGAPDSLVSARLRCGLANVTQETYAAWNSAYHDNANPVLEGLTLTDGATEVALSDDGAATVAPGAAVDLTVGWPDCPATGTCGDGICSADETLTSCPEDCTTPVGCGGAETYAIYTPATKTLETHREAISATWFTTGGTFDAARNGRTGDETDTALDNGWTAPSTPGDVWFGVVLRDERGGVSFGGYRVTVAAP
jgi:hypothetical protein